MPKGNVVADSNVGKRQQVKLGHQILYSFYNIFVFSATSREEWLIFFEKGLGLYFYLSSFLGLLIFKTGLYLYDLIVSKNKNIGKVGSFLREFCGMIILLVAVFGGLSTSVTMALAIPWLYVASFGVNILYNLSVTIQNAYQWAKCPDPVISQKYKESFKNHLLTTVFVSLLATAFTFLMGVEIVPTAMAIVSACLYAVSFVFGLVSAYKKYRSTQYQEPIAAHFVEIQEGVPRPFREPAEKPKNCKGNDYYFYEHNQAEDLLYQYDPAHYLLQQIDQKISLLYSEINRDKNQFFSQENKRLIKISVLEELKSLVLDPAKTKADFYLFLKEPVFERQIGHPFQSFFRQKGQVQGLIEAAELYYTQLQAPHSQGNHRRLV